MVNQLEKISTQLKEQFANYIEKVIINETGETVTIKLKPDVIPQVAEFLKNWFDYFCFVTALDYPQKFELIYYFYSTARKQYLKLNVELPKEEPAIHTIACVWPGAEWHERETYDLFGIQFTGHPDLRRILLPDDWQGYPLRKNGVSEENDKN